ncbi:MAG TPA: hypothetical protein VF756_00395 [Thermoanaerobaculia bacterium]
MPAPRSVLVLPVVQTAKTGGEDEAVHNWDKVLCQYNNGSAGTEVDDAFMQAGYSDPSTRRKAILRALREKGWAKSKIAHSLGGQQSGKRGGTDTKIQTCKKDLMEWLKTHPGGSTTISGSEKRRKGGRAQIDEEGYDKERIRVILLAKWAREGDQEAKKRLRELAESGNQTAQEKLAELEPPTQQTTASPVTSSLPHSHSSTTTTSNLAVHPPPQIGVPPLTVRQLELLYPGQTAGGQSFGIWGVDHTSQSPW